MVTLFIHTNYVPRYCQINGVLNKWIICSICTPDLVGQDAATNGMKTEYNKTVWWWRRTRAGFFCFREPTIAWYQQSDIIFTCACSTTSWLQVRQSHFRLPPRCSCFLSPQSAGTPTWAGHMNLFLSTQDSSSTYHLAPKTISATHRQRRAWPLIGKRKIA